MSYILKRSNSSREWYLILSIQQNSGIHSSKYILEWIKSKWPKPFSPLNAIVPKEIKVNFDSKSKIFIRPWNCYLLCCHSVLLLKCASPWIDNHFKSWKMKKQFMFKWKSTALHIKANQKITQEEWDFFFPDATLNLQQRYL